MSTYIDPDGEFTLHRFQKITGKILRPVKIRDKLFLEFKMDDYDEDYKNMMEFNKAFQSHYNKNFKIIYISPEFVEPLNIDGMNKHMIKSKEHYESEKKQERDVAEMHNMAQKIRDRNKENNKRPRDQESSDLPLKRLRVDSPDTIMNFPSAINAYENMLKEAAANKTIGGKRRKKRGGHHLFKRLGVSRKATKRQIKKAYEKKKKKGKLSKRVKYAYRILSNPKSRKKYLDSYKKTKKHKRKNQRGCSRKRKR